VGLTTKGIQLLWHIEKEMYMDFFHNLDKQYRFLNNLLLENITFSRITVLLLFSEEGHVASLLVSSVTPLPLSEKRSGY